jgi:hypothetical protein
VHQLAKAGARLYSSEQDYTGLVALDPFDPNRLFMSSAIDPRNDASLGVHELFEGKTTNGGVSWAWTPITFNSQVDNLRPIVPIWDANHTTLLWMRGTYSSQLDYNMDIVGLTSFGNLQGMIEGDLNGDRALDLADFAIYISYMHTNLNTLSAEQAYARGDLNGDFTNDAQDFFLFRAAYNETNGSGSFEAALASVPEPVPVTGQTLAAAIFVGAIWRRRGSRLP